METTSAETSSPSSDERIMAALAHVTVVLPFMGIVAPIVIWATQREKSRYVSFQALQATAYQVMIILAWFVAMACYMCSFFSSFAGIFAVGASGPPSGSVNGPAAAVGFAAFMLPFAIIALIFIGGFVLVVYGLVGTIQVLRGKPFRYILVGRRIEQYLREAKPSPT